MKTKFYAWIAPNPANPGQQSQRIGKIEAAARSMGLPFRKEVVNDIVIFKGETDDDELAVLFRLKVDESLEISRETDPDE